MKMLYTLSCTLISLQLDMQVDFFLLKIIRFGVSAYLGKSTCLYVLHVFLFN